MGTLHEVYQIKPRVLSGGALLKIKTAAAPPAKAEPWQQLPRNVVLQATNPDLKVFGMYQEDRIITNPEAGHYLLIQSGSKYGFDHHFQAFFETNADKLEDFCFYVGWGDWGYCYQLKANQFAWKRFSLQSKTLAQYLLESYKNDPFILPGIYLEELLEAYHYCLEMEEEGTPTKNRRIAMIFKLL